MFDNPAFKRFTAQIDDELILAQVLIRRTGAGFELRHAEDAAVDKAGLRMVKVEEARNLAQFTFAGEFRPLKSAPTLQRGWRIIISNEADLERVLNQLYPGAVADWFAIQDGRLPVTHYREYVERQTGMYRITAMLNDSQATKVIEEVCAMKCCLKRRLWTVPCLEPDAVSAKSLIPCLEPCAVLMGSARQTVRAEQQEKSPIHLAGKGNTS